MNKLAEWIGGVNEANGFDKPTWDSLPTKLMLVVTELNEARDSVMGDGKDPLAEELADTAIRLFDILRAVWPSEWSFRTSHTKTNSFQAIEGLLWPTLSHVCSAVESWRHENRTDAKICVELALCEVYRLAEILGYDMNDEIEKKVNKNASRGHLHGKKRSGG